MYIYIYMISQQFVHDTLKLCPKFHSSKWSFLYAENTCGRWSPPYPQPTSSHKAAEECATNREGFLRSHALEPCLPGQTTGRLMHSSSCSNSGGSVGVTSRFFQPWNPQPPRCPTLKRWRGQRRIQSGRGGGGRGGEGDRHPLKSLIEIIPNNMWNIEPNYQRRVP